MRNNNLTTLALIALATVASASQAQNLGVLPHGEMDSGVTTAFVSQRSRAEVIAELQQSGRATINGEWGGVVAPSTSTTSRAAVLAELQRASARGEVQHGEASVAVTGLAGGARDLALNGLSRPLLPAGEAQTRLGEASGSEPQALVSTRSRAEVRAETLDAMAQGTLPHGEANPVAAARADSSLTRTAVRAEAREAVARHELSTGEVVR